MKKVITLLLIVSTVASASAQTSQEESRRVVLGTGGGSKTERSTGSGPVDVILGRDRRVEDNQGTRYPNGTYGSREQQIDQVNREYDRKINSIRNNRTLSAAEKERMIRQLENDRARRIREIDNRYYGDRDNRRYDDDNYAKKNKKYKSNNGNHYGWEKGVGNPHRTGNGNSKGKGNGKGKS